MRRIRASRISVTDARALVAVLALAAIGCVHESTRKQGDFTAPATRHTWAETGWEDRHTTMTFTVLPNMGRLWQKFTASDAPTLTCRTCHGQDAEDVKYRMPNPSLPALDRNRLPDASSRDPREAKWAAFMRNDVVPMMTNLIDADPYDPKTGKGFFCFNCHTEKKS